MNFFARIVYQVSLVGYIDFTIIPTFLKVVFVRFRYFYFPTIVFYVRSGLPEGIHGSTYWMFIFIRRQSLFDKPLLTHEVVHVRQVLRSGFLHNFYYNSSNEYKYHMELEAYAYQCLHTIKLIIDRNKHLGKDEYDLNFYILDTIFRTSVRLSTKMRKIYKIQKDFDTIDRDFKVYIIAILLNSIYKEEIVKNFA